MNFAKRLILSCFFLVFALWGGASYAQENDDTVFLSGMIGANINIRNCPGNCSAELNRTIGMGLTGGYQLDPDWGLFIYRFSTSLDFSRFQFNVNGNAVNVNAKAFHIHLETALQAHPRYSLVVTLGPNWMTASSPNTLDRTVVAGGGEIYLLYQMTHSLYLSLGSTTLIISPPNQPDFYPDTVDIGFRWYL